MPTADDGGAGEDDHGGERMRERTAGLVAQQPEVEGDVIQVDGDGRDESRDIELTRQLDEAAR